LGHMHLAALGQGGVLRNLSWARKAHVAHMPETLVLSINREEIPISCNTWRAAPYSNKESVPLYTLILLCSTIIQISSPWTTLGSKGFLTALTAPHPPVPHTQHKHPRWVLGTERARAPRFTFFCRRDGMRFFKPTSRTWTCHASTRIIGRRTTHGSEPLDRSVFITSTENGGWGPPAVCEFINARTLVGRLFFRFRMGGTNPAGGDDNVGIDRPLSGPNGGSTKVRQGSRRRCTAQPQLAVPQRRIRSRIASARFSPTGIALAHGRFQRPAVDGTEKREREREKRESTIKIKQASTTLHIEDHPGAASLSLFFIIIITGQQGNTRI
jgi:hypothetical protein